MNQARHTKEELDAVRKCDVPTLTNAIETFEVVPSNTGCCNSSMKCLFPDMPTMLGYAVTARVSTDLPPSDVRPGVDEPEYWRFVYDLPGPKVCVFQDIDKVNKGANFGEWYSNVHKALGCVGVVADGCVRDVDAVANLDFHMFSTGVHPANGNGNFIDYGGAVRVADLIINTGDLLIGDRHGVVRIPAEIPLLKLVEVANEITRLEKEIFDCCQSPDFTVDRLAKVNHSVMYERWPKPLG